MKVTQVYIVRLTGREITLIVFALVNSKLVGAAALASKLIAQAGGVRK